MLVVQYYKHSGLYQVVNPLTKDVEYFQTMLEAKDYIDFFYDELQYGDAVSLPNHQSEFNHSLSDIAGFPLCSWIKSMECKYYNLINNEQDND